METTQVKEASSATLVFLLMVFQAVAEGKKSRKLWP